MSDPRTVLNNASLSTDLDAAGHKILNLPNDQPLPPPVIPAGTIIDSMVSASAAIEQSKLSLNGSIPTAWLGASSTTAAQGNLTEYTANKDQPNGYPSLDNTGKIPLGELPASVGTGTVTSVGVTTANGVSATGGPITSSGSFTFSLGAITPASVSVTGTAGAGYVKLAPQSTYATQFPAIFVENSANRLAFQNATGIAIYFNPQNLTATRQIVFPDKSGTAAYTSDIPVTFVGVGSSHATGLVPDPGGSGTTTDYLARDATWKSLPASASYQPTMTTPTINASTNTTGPRLITFGPTHANVFMFYDIGSNTGPFIEWDNVSSISLPILTTIYVYAARPGYTNSAMGNYTNPNTT
jgi:hypothetical protein